MRYLIILVSLMALSTSCSTDPEPIHYGEDNCAHCRMTIMDHRYGTEIVTDKGKIYKFDSVECLVEFINDKKDGDEVFSLMLCTPFDQPGQMADATECTYLHSRNLPSPMGMYLTAFESEATAYSFKDQFGGKVYCWKGLNENFNLFRQKGAPD
jgi:copper chaperone NosL